MKDSWKCSKWFYSLHFPEKCFKFTLLWSRNRNNKGFKSNYDNDEITACHQEGELEMLALIQTAENSGSPFKVLPLKMISRCPV